MKQLCQNAQFSFHANENLMGVMISYLDCKDIVSLSQVNKLYQKATKTFDYYFKEVSYNYFFSQYETYNLDNQLNCSNIVSSSCEVPDGEEEKKHSINEQSLSPSLYTWKGLFEIGVYIKDSWLSNDHHQLFRNDLTQIHNFLYSNLKECEILPRLRKQNHIVEGKFNSPFQTFLYDFLYEQQDLYDEYDCKMGEYKTQAIQCLKVELPFCNLICKFKPFIQSIIDSPNKRETLKQLRWYTCFDKYNNTNKQQSLKTVSRNQINDWPNDDNDNSFRSSSCDINDSNDNDDLVLNNHYNSSQTHLFEEHSCLIKGDNPIELSRGLVNKILLTEDNPLFFVIDCICLTMTFYCQYTMNYLFLSFNKDRDMLLSQYIKIYKNYVDTAIGFNDYCENINVALNYCYEEIWKDHASFPKFSIFRLLILTWNRELTNRLNKNDTTMLESLKANLLSIVSQSLSEFAQKSLMKSNCDGRKSKDIEGECSIEESVSTKYSSILQSELVNSVSPLSIDDCFQEEESLSTIVMEQGLSALSDTFIDEYSVFSLNLSHFEVNSFYKDIEDAVIEKIQLMVKQFYESKVYQQSIQVKVVIDSILQYFSTNTYSSKIITQFKLRIYQSVQSLLINMIQVSMENDLKNFISSNKLSATKEFKANTYFDLHPNTLTNDKLYQTLVGFLSSVNVPSIVRDYCAIRYIKEKSKQSTGYIALIRQVSDWMTEEQEKSVYKNKQVANELKRKNIQEYTKHQKQMLSYCWRLNWETIEKANEMAKAKHHHALSLMPNHFQSNSIMPSANKHDLALILKLV